MGIDEIGPAVLGTLRDTDDLADLAIQLSDLLLDEFLDEGFAQNVPVVEFVRKFCKATNSYSNYLPSKKLVMFLRGLAGIPIEQRRDQIARMMVDTEYRQQVGENLMLLLDKLMQLAMCGLLDQIHGRRGAVGGQLGGLRRNDLGRIFAEFIIP